MSDNFSQERWLLKVFNPEGMKPNQKKVPYVVGRVTSREDGNLWVNPDVSLQGKVLAEKLRDKDPNTGAYPDKNADVVEKARRWVLYIWREIESNGQARNLPTTIGRLEETRNGDLQLHLINQVSITQFDRLSAEPEEQAIARQEQRRARAADAGGQPPTTPARATRAPVMV